MSYKHKTGLNFKKLIKKLSDNALKYLINIAYHEASYRNLKINTPNLGEDLPILEIKGGQILNIRDKQWKIVSFTYGNGEWDDLITDYGDTFTITINLDEYNWFQKYKDRTPISVKLVAVENEQEEKIIEFHSRSKIFWFNKILQNNKKLPDIESSSSPNMF